MKKICLLLIIVLSLGSCMTIDYVYPIDFVYVNNSGVEVAIVGKNKRYPEVPDSLVIANGASYRIQGIVEGPDPYGSGLGETNPVIKVYFNKEILVLHDNDCYLKNVRDIRESFYYSYVKTGERSTDAIYTFTPEDYQLALDLQK